MNDVYDKLDGVFTELDKLEVFKNLSDSILKIKENKELIEKIEKYNNTYDEKLRLDIYNYNEIKEYKALENEVNFIILEINQKLKKISDNRSCLDESN